MKRAIILLGTCLLLAGPAALPGQASCGSCGVNCPHTGVCGSQCPPSCCSGVACNCGGDACSCPLRCAYGTNPCGGSPGFPRCCLEN